MERLPAVGEPVSLATELVVREDGWALYGFLDGGGRGRRRNAGAARAPAPDPNVSVTTMPVAWTTAEWICTRCGSTNRKLVPAGAGRAADECVTCHTRHDLEPEERPVRWRARPMG